MNYGDTFEILQEPDYVVGYPNDASISVLLSKEWFELCDQSKPLATLIFRSKSEIPFKNEASYNPTTVSRDVYVRNKVKRSVKADFEE